MNERTALAIVTEATSLRRILDQAAIRISTLRTIYAKELDKEQDQWLDNAEGGVANASDEDLNDLIRSLS